MERVLQFRLDYTEDITIMITGMRSEIESLLFAGDRGGDLRGPIAVFAEDENGRRETISPQERYRQQLQAVQNALVSDRGVDQPQEAVTEGIVLPTSLTPYLDELPAWLQPYIVKPVAGFLSHPALLPRQAVEEWTRSLATLRAIAEAHHLRVAPSDRAMIARGVALRQIDGFLAINVIDRGVRCKEWLFDSHDQGSGSLRAYSFRSTQNISYVQCCVSRGSADVHIYADGQPLIPPVEDLRPVHGCWPPTNQARISSDREITTVVRRHTPLEGCSYTLRGGCQVNNDVL